MAFVKAMVLLFELAPLAAANICNDRQPVQNWGSFDEPIYLLISSEEYKNILTEQLREGAKTAVFSSASFTEIVNTLMGQVVPDTGKTIGQVLGELAALKEGCSVYLVGGVVRDAIISSKTGTPLILKDVDVEMQCGQGWSKKDFVDDMGSYCKENFGDDLCYAEYDPEDNFAVVTIGNTAKPFYIDAHHWDDIINNTPVKSWEFDVNTMVSERKYNYIIDLTGLGLGGVCGNPSMFKIPVKQSLWDDWLKQSNGQLRYWKLRLKQFVAEQESKEYLVPKTVDIITSADFDDRYNFAEFYCGELLVADSFDYEGEPFNCIAFSEERLVEIKARKVQVDGVFQQDIDSVMGEDKWNDLVQKNLIPNVVLGEGTCSTDGARWYQLGRAMRRRKVQSCAGTDI